MDDSDQQCRTIRITVPSRVHVALRHLAIDLDLGLDALLLEAAVLLLRYHERADDLPEPLPPAVPDEL
jgi:hypothetical protein